MWPGRWGRRDRWKCGTGRGLGARGGVGALGAAWKAAEEPAKKPWPPSTPAVDGGYFPVSFCMGLFLLSLSSVRRKGHGVQSLKHRWHGLPCGSLQAVLRLWGCVFPWERGKGGGPLPRRVSGYRCLSVYKTYNKTG